ncbi:MAG: pyruvate dehydrogenase (acetyl-transferring) E1 component subunit alpha [Deltaproteobacteria bacterium]|nr:pyruvate dehydrogenase (acetyl-transferring) E1 component subunit alpha [Deltaproteobacteria bacterium]
MVAVPKNDDVRRILDEEGNVFPGVQVPDIPEADLRRLYRQLLLIRVLDERMLRLQRQGRLGFYMTAMGEEATHLAVYALRPTDWIFPSYREPGAAFFRGYTLREYICQLYGNAEDPVKGRQMPVHHSVRRVNFVSVSSPVGTQIPQAVGMAMAAKCSGKDDVAICYFGEGATSTGDFHVGMNFAGVFKAPVIFFCRNNGWAISTSRDKQTAAKTFAIKAAAYGFPGIRVDGNDILAIIQAAGEAAARGRAGDGPTMIEALTYRRGAHSSSDDPSVYRDPNEPKQWEAKDPIERFRRYLAKSGLWTEAWETELREEIDAEIADAHDYAQALGAPPVESLFEDVYEQIPKHLVEQREWLFQQPRTKNPHVH